MAETHGSGLDDAAIRQHEQAWIARMMSTGRADRAAAEDAAERLYSTLGLAAPKRIEWAEGPRELAAQRERAWRSEPVGANLMESVNARLAQTNGTLADGARRHPLYQRRDAMVMTYSGLRVFVSTLIDQETTSSSTGSPLARLAAWLGNARRPPRWCTIATGGRSQLDAGQLAFQNLLYAAYGLRPEHAELLRALADVTANAGWVVPHENVCWLSDRPESLQVDQRVRLHAQEGPALGYRDGLEIHAWKGVRIPGWLTAKPESITVGIINRERDAFVRRCMIELMTPARFIAAGGARVASRDATGTLWMTRWVFDAWAAVEVVNGTPEPDGTFKHYFLQVPPEMQSARQAVAWTYDLTESQYARLVVRT